MNGSGKQQMRLTPSLPVLFRTEKRAWMPRATHRLYKEMMSAGDAVGASCWVVVSPLTILAQVGTVSEGER